MSELNFYADESSQNSHRYMVLGGIAVEIDSVPLILQRFAEIRQRHNLKRELKWGRVSTAKAQAYQEVIDLFFALSRADNLHFHALIVDTYEFDHKKYNLGDSEIGFNKLIYQLLIHKCGRRYGRNYKLYTYLDQRTTKQSLSDLQNMLNSGLAKSWKIHDRPFRRVVFQDSKGSDIMQVNDILIGAIAHRKNKHYEKIGACKAKIAMANHIAQKAGLVDLVWDTHFSARTFTIWNFHFQEKKNGPVSLGF